VSSLTDLERTPQDELILADNTRAGTLVGLSLPDGLTVVRAGHERSSYHARNVGAENARNPWVLFIDADCRPSPSLLDQYFAVPIPDECGAVAGEVVGAAGQSTAPARYALAREHLRQARFVRPAGASIATAATANFLLRRAAWSALGGFCEGIRSGGDFDLSRRLQAAGWTLEYRPQAIVEHIHRERTADLARQWMSYGAGAAWQRRRHAHAYRVPWRHVRSASRNVLAAGFFAATRRRDRALLASFDALAQCSFVVGWFRDNRAEELHGRDVTGVALVGEFPDETLDPESVPAVALHVEASARPQSPSAWKVRHHALYYAEDDGDMSRLTSLVRLLAVHPRRTVRACLRVEASGEARIWKLAPTAVRLARLGRLEQAIVAPSRSADASTLARVLGRSGVRR
jgi:GT2 family glycosyltransferase